MVEEKVFRVILSYKRRLVRRLKKRKPGEKLKRRTYYRKNKRKILLRRKRYLVKNKPFLKTRKLYKRQKPKWISQRKTLTSKVPKLKIIKPKKHPHSTTKPFKPKKIHVPKRT